MFYLEEGYIDVTVTLQGRTKEFEYTTVYGRYIHKMHLNAIISFEILVNLYMLLRISAACSPFKIYGVTFIKKNSQLQQQVFI